MSPFRVTVLDDVDLGQLERGFNLREASIATKVISSRLLFKRGFKSRPASIQAGTVGVQIEK